MYMAESAVLELELAAQNGGLIGVSSIVYIVHQKVGEFSILYMM
jgi:hypothetical protein